MQYLKWTACWAVMVAACAGCSDSQPGASHEVAIGDVPTLRIERHREWRDARAFGARGRHVIELGPAPEQGVLRLGVFEEESRLRSGEVSVYVGDRLVRTIDMDDHMGWSDFRIDVSGGNAGEACRLELDVDIPMWLGPCEIVDTESAPTSPNVLVFLIDTLRLDHMSLYGYARETTPNIDAFAREATVFTQLMPQSSWTRPSVASLLTSTYPNVHGAQTRQDKIREGLPSLARTLEDNGYETHQFMTNPNCLPIWGFGDDFSRYVDVHSADYKKVEVDRLAIKGSMATLENVQGRPWFMYVHVMGPHDPYGVPEEYRGRFVTNTTGLSERERRDFPVIDHYDDEILYSDALFGRLMDRLKDLGLYDNTAIVVLSDHGEEFHEHGGWGHGKSLFEEVLRVPLLIKPPGGAWRAGERIDSLVEIVDIAPTLLEIVGAPVPDGFQGASILNLLRGEAASPRVGYASLTIDQFSVRAAKLGDRKFIRNLVDQTDRWYSLSEDPGEHKPLSVAPAWGVPLEQYLARKAVEGASGLHVLITRGEEQLDFSATIAGDTLGDAEVDSWAWESELDESDGRVRLDLAKGDPNEVYERSVDMDRKFRRPYAHVRLPVEGDGSITLEFSVDGRPVGRRVFHAGGDDSGRGLDGRPFRPLEVEADPEAFDLGGLPHAFGVHVWYVADVESLDDSEVPEDVMEALRGLGYLE